MKPLVVLVLWVAIDERYCRAYHVGHRASSEGNVNVVAVSAFKNSPLEAIFLANTGVNDG